MTKRHTIKHLAEETSPLGQENQQMQILNLAGFFLWNVQATKFRRKSPSIELQIWKQRTLDDILGPLRKAIREWDSWAAKLSDFGIEHRRKQVTSSKCHIKVQKLCKRKSQNIKMGPLLRKSRRMMKKKNCHLWPYSHNPLPIIECAKLIYGKSIMANWLYGILAHDKPI